MRPIARFLIFCALISFNLSCSVNVLENFADKTTNDALYVDAQLLMSKKDYSGALAKIASMTGDYPAKREVLMLKASAYGGLCGLDFLDFVKKLGDMGGTRLFPLLLGAFRAGTTTDSIDKCKLAQATIESIGATSARTSDENMLMVLILFSKIGNILSYYADTDQDGVVTAAYDVCAIGGGTRTAGGAIDDSDLRELGTGITLAVQNISAVSSTVNLGNASLADVQSACTQLAGINPAYDFCSVTDPAAFTATQLKGIRSLLKEDQSVGLGANCTGDLTACNCP
jgi:hypothetical protein